MKKNIFELSCKYIKQRIELKKSDLAILGIL